VALQTYWTFPVARRLCPNCCCLLWASCRRDLLF